MKYRKFGRTDLQVSEVIFGKGAVGGILINANLFSDRKRTAPLPVELRGELDRLADTDFGRIV